MTSLDIWVDAPTEEYVPEGGTKFYYLVCYDTNSGEWDIDNDTIYLPESPIYDPKTNGWRKIELYETTRDIELANVLKETIGRIRDV